jgi:hypothetical protein
MIRSTKTHSSRFANRCGYSEAVLGPAGSAEFFLKKIMSALYQQSSEAADRNPRRFD